MQKCVHECHSCIIYHSQKVRATCAHQLVGGRQNVAPACRNASGHGRKEVLIHVTAQMNLEHAEWKKSVTKAGILYDSMYTFAEKFTQAESSTMVTVGRKGDE